MYKVCKKCQKRKAINEFQVCSRNKDGHTGMCKECKRVYDNTHYKNNPKRKKYIRQNSNKRININRNYIWEYFKSHPCVDCGESDPIVLEFDHLNDKLYNIGNMMNIYGLDRVEKEIAKCEVRCANCHRRKTAKDFGHWKFLFNKKVIL